MASGSYEQFVLFAHMATLNLPYGLYSMLALPAGNVIFQYDKGMMQWIYSGWVPASWVLKTLGNP